MKITYKELADRLDGMVLANGIAEYAFNNCLDYEELSGSMDDENGDMKEFYQFFIVSESDAEYLARNTDETVLSFDYIDAYIWCIDHFGTSWEYVHVEVKE